MNKVCNTCNESKEADGNFYRSKRDGYQARCIDCSKKKNKIERKVYESKPERKASKRRWARGNPDKVRLSRARYYTNNKEKYRAWTTVYRNNRNRNGGHFSQVEWDIVVQLHGNRCAACGIYCSPEVDHVIPVSLGGTSDISNIQPLCRRCNATKGNRNSNDYRICSLRSR